jgi:hypothetical protein
MRTFIGAIDLSVARVVDLPLREPVRINVHFVG